MEKKLFDKLKKAASQAADHAEGKKVASVREHKVTVPITVDAAAIRKGLGMTQKEFSETFGFAVRTIASWESGERTPEPAARVLLNTIAFNPEVVLAANQRPMQ